MRTITGTKPITANELRDFLHLDHGGDDAQLQRCVDAGIDFVEMETERDILVGDIVQDFSLPNCLGITLDRSPVLEVVSVSDLDPADYVVRRRSGRWRIVFSSPYTEVIVNYRTGMESPSPLVVQACLWAAAHFYLNREPEVIGGSVNQFEAGLNRLINKLKAASYA